MTAYEWACKKYGKKFQKSLKNSNKDYVINEAAKLEMATGEFGEDIAEIESMLIDMYQEQAGCKFE